MPLPRRCQYHREVTIGALTHPAGAAAAVSEGRLEVRLAAPGPGVGRPDDEYHHDAGLMTKAEVRAVGPVACHRVGDSVQAAIVVQSLGMRDPHFFFDQFGGGSASHTVVGQAAIAVAAGVADYVVCWRAINARSEWRMGGTGRPPRPSRAMC